MTRDESIALWKQGKDVWNEWANGMLAERKRLEDAREWEAERDFFGNFIGKNLQTKEWLSGANIDLSKLWIFVKHKSRSSKEREAKSRKRTSLGINKDHIDFSVLIFPNDATFQDTLFDSVNVDFQESTFRGVAKFEGSIFNGSAQFQSINFNLDANFNHSNFKYRSYFFRAKFGQNADFSSATFIEYADFNSTLFTHSTNFNSAIFRGKVEFYNVKFLKDVSFESATFCERVIFGAPFSLARNRATKFVNVADFSQVHFEKPVSFAHAIFESTANFAAITSDKSFNLLHTNFAQVPDFTEAAFHVPPLLDDIDIEAALQDGLWDPSNEKKDPRPEGSFYTAVAPNSTDYRKYRALGKMAADGNDYQNAMEAFANEIRCRRFWKDKPLGKGMGRFWFGLFYECSSNFGRGFIQPIIGWLSSTVLFAFLYAQTSNCDDFDWFDPIYISIRHGLIFSDLTRSEHWDSAITALYATTKGDKPTIDISNTAASLMLAQPIISAVFIFLFLLAMRNQFKIR